MNLDVSLLDLLTLIVNVVLPVLVGLVTTKVTSSGIKATLLAFFTAVNGFVSEWIAAGEGVFDIKSALFTWLSGFVVAVAVHYGFWKPTGVTEQALTHGRRSAAA